MNPGSRPTRIGIISDTHGLLRPEAVAALRGVELIIHAGDVGGSAGVDGKAEILRALEAVAPVVAVRGNVDTEAWGRELRETEVVKITVPGKEIPDFKFEISDGRRINAIRKSKIHRRDAEAVKKLLRNGYWGSSIFAFFRSLNVCRFASFRGVLDHAAEAGVGGRPSRIHCCRL